MSECNGIVFYRSFYEAVKNLPPEEYKKAVSAILEYGLNGVEPENSGGIEWMVYTLTKPQIDANQKRRESGSKGGKSVSDSKQNEATFKQTEANSKQIEANNKQIEAKVKDKVKDKAKAKEKVKVKEKDILSAPTLKHEIYGEFGNVMLTGEEFKKLVDSLGSTKTSEYIERLSSYLAQTGKRYKSHYATILNWSRRDNPVSNGEFSQHNSYDLDAFERNLDKIPTL